MAGMIALIVAGWLGAAVVVALVAGRWLRVGADADAVVDLRGPAAPDPPAAPDQPTAPPLPGRRTGR
jgi:hypothetical protein